MKYSQILVLLIASVLLVGAGIAYDTGGSSSPQVQCNDNTDNDNDGQIDGDGDTNDDGAAEEEPDSGCVRPYYDDDSEGDIWDTDMTALILGGSVGSGSLSKDYSVFFDGAVYRGDRNTQEAWDGDTLRIAHIDGVYPEGSSFGGGQLERKGYSSGEFPQGTVYPSESQPGRVIDPPNPANQGGEVVGSPVTCGDGIENEGIDKTGSSAGTTNPTTPCRQDFGRVKERYDIKEGSTQEGYCRNDDGASCDSASATCDPGGSYPSCGADCTSTSADCSVSNPHDEDDGNTYWWQNGDFLYQNKCNEQTCNEYGDSGCLVQDRASCSASGGTAASECLSRNEEGTCVSYRTYCSSSGGDCEIEPSETEDAAGDTRNWLSKTKSVNCNSNNVVDGGGGSGGSKPDNDQAGTFTDFTAYGDQGAGSGEDRTGKTNTDWCGYDTTLTVDADGPNGYGDGWVVIHDGEIVGTEGPTGDDTVGQSVHVDGSETSRNYLGDISTSCSATTCLKYVDFYTVEGSANRGNPDWTTVDGAVTHQVVDTFTPSKSYSACKNMNRIWRDNHGLDDSSSLVQCDTSENRNSGGNLISPSNNEVGGDQENEYWVYMEGPEVNEEQFDDNPGHFQGNVDNFNDCILRGQEVSEGYVGNVAPQSSTDQYEKGGNSPDWEVCLNLGEFGDSDPGDDMGGDNYCMDQQGVIDNEAYENGNCNDPQDAGGEWYDLDSETAQEYLRSTEGEDLIQNGDSSDPRNIAYYWENNQNPPQDSEFNPEGGRSGTAMEDDCGNPRFDSLNCNDPITSTNREATFFSFFEEGLREEDYNPQGESSGENKLDGFTGYMNRLQDRSNQLESGMETDTYDPSNQEFHENSVGGDDADAWAITEELTWSIDTTGVPYPPYSTYYRDQSDQRGTTDASSVDKRAKAFANSFAAVATDQFTDQQGVTVNTGDGVWIDPDAIIDNTDKVKLTPDGSGWRSAFSSSDETGTNVGFKIDLTGPDSGLGIDVSPFSGENPECLNRNSEGGCRVRADDVYWERNDAGNIESEFEKNVCGDDRLEFFIEETGESTNSERYDGEYACSDSLNSCYDSSNPVGERVVDQGSYSNTDEPGEDVGRFKEDQEICQKIDGQDDFAIWYDQDYRESFCNANTLYGNEGVRWFDEEYVSNYPQAVKWGIDDSWNKNMIQRGHESYDSQPGTTGPGITPVPTGNQFDKTATKGFCGGDDGSEYLATQECNTQYCETDRTVQGVGKTPGSCVLSRSENTQYSTNVDRRTVFEPGDEVTIQEVSGQPTIACFNGAWFSDWPINFNQEEIDVPLGETRTVTFEVINVRGTEQTFDVTMEEDSDNPSADQFASFVEKEGKEFRTTLEPEGSKTFSIELRGGNLDLNNDDLTVRADAVNSQQFGSDSISVSVVDPGSSTGRQGTQEVPGIQALQLVALFVSATLIFVVHGRS